ncbi:hypothetical protein FRC11_011326, partial [Ceratobasidium sp. 423]
CKQICNGVAYLHEIGIVHGDLKGGNILISSGGIAVVADFGGSRLENRSLEFTQSTSKSGPCYTLRWAAPELLDTDATTNNKTDIYALGMTILETMTDEVPWAKIHHDYRIYVLVSQKQHPERPSQIPASSPDGDKLWDLLRSCWSFEPTQRPVATEVAGIMKTITSEGLQDPESIAKLEAEAMSCLESEKLERGTNILLNVLKLRRCIQGDNSPFTIQTMLNLALGCEAQSKFNHAIRILDTSLKYLNRSHADVKRQFRSIIEERLTNLRKKQQVTRPPTTSQRTNSTQGADSNNPIEPPNSQTPEAIIALFTNQRCPNLTDRIDTARCSKVVGNRGEHGDIWQGMLIEGRPIAMKRIYPSERKMDKRLAQELDTWSKTDHENVLELLGIAYYQNYLVMISPWMSYGSIHDYLEQYPDTNRLQISVQLAGGVAHLHHIGIVHGDLKGQHVFVSQEGVLKVAEFGLAVTLGDPSVAFQPSSTGAGSSTPGTAPELYQVESTVSQESDVYSLGMTIYEIFSNRVPFSEFPDTAILKTVILWEKIPTFPEEIKALGQYGLTLWGLLCKCWDHDPKQRPTADQVLRE